MRDISKRWRICIQSKQEHKVRLRDGSTRTVRSKLVPERREPFFEQMEEKIQHGLTKPEIGDSELTEDLYRMTKSSTVPTSTPTPPPQSKKSLVPPKAAPRKKRR